MVISSVVQGGSMISRFILIITVVFILMSVVVIVIEKKNIVESIYGVGETFFLSTKSLADAFRNIIDNGGIVNLEGSTKDNLLNIWSTYSKLFLALLSMIFWLKILAFFISHSPVGDETSFFKTYFLAIIFFYVFQVLFILSYAGINKEVNGFIGDKSVTYYLSLPITSFYYFIKCVPYLMKSFTK